MTMAGLDYAEEYKHIIGEFIMRIVRLKDLMILSVFALAACGGGGRK